MVRRLWTHEEQMVTLRLYLQLTINKMTQRNPEVTRLASLIGRSPASVALRLGNYAALDPLLQRRGIKGMANGGRMCREYWERFVEDKEAFLFESERILSAMEGKTVAERFGALLLDLPGNIAGESRERIVRARVNQHTFRQIVLANYGKRCALTGIGIPQLLVASHILPWANSKKERMNPSNGICLSAMYDKAFDVGLISFDDDLKAIFSNRLLSEVGNEAYGRFFEPFRGRRLAQPLKYEADRRFLEWHRDSVFNMI